MKTYSTPHYIFTYEEGSLAEKDIKMIADVQENSFNKICETLKVDFPEKIKYYLLDSKEKVGKLYGDNTPINGFAVWGENKVYAVYNNDTKCIGLMRMLILSHLLLMLKYLILLLKDSQCTLMKNGGDNQMIAGQHIIKRMMIPYLFLNY